MTKRLLSILLCALMAAPTLSLGEPARVPPAPTAATTALPHLQDAAFRAGVSTSRDVFLADLERTDSDAAAPQSNRELRTICLANCERELQQCESDRRAGVHTKNCAAILDACTDVCWARWPAPPPESEEDLTWVWILGIAAAAFVYWLVASQEAAFDEIGSSPISEPIAR